MVRTGGCKVLGRGMRCGGMQRACVLAAPKHRVHTQLQGTLGLDLVFRSALTAAHVSSHACFAVRKLCQKPTELSSAGRSTDRG